MLFGLLNISGASGSPRTKGFEDRCGTGPRACLHCPWMSPRTLRVRHESAAVGLGVRVTAPTGSKLAHASHV